MSKLIISIITFCVSLVLVSFVLISGCTTNPVVTKGTIQVTSSPSGAEVYLDNQYHGTTPTTISDVSVGSHTVELRYHNYQTWSTTLIVNQGSESIISTTLSPFSSPITTPIPTSAYRGIEQSTANIMMIGNVYGISSNPAAGIDEIKFSIGLAPGAPAVDLTTLKIVFSTPSTSPRILTWGGTASTSIFNTKLNGVAPVSSMNSNDQIEVDFKTAAVTANTKINIELRPSVGAALPLAKTAPPSISSTNVLY